MQTLVVIYTHDIVNVVFDKHSLILSTMRNMGLSKHSVFIVLSKDHTHCYCNVLCIIIIIVLIREAGITS